MSSRLRFFGVAAYELINPSGQHILIDPFLDQNPGSTVRSDQLDRVDLIIVSHAAPDHLGDTEVIPRRTGAPIICGGEVKAFSHCEGYTRGTDPRDYLGNLCRGGGHQSAAG